MINWPIEIGENKYKKWYELLILKAQTRGNIDGYKERHHIVPNCFVKNDNDDNLIYLTAREHYIAHLLLWKIPMSKKHHNQMTMALNVMVNGSGHKKQDRSYFVNSRLYEVHRKEYSAYLSLAMKGEGNSFYGKKHTPETIEKIKAANARTKDIRSAKFMGANNPMYGKHHSEEIRARISTSTAASWSDEDKKAKSEWAKQKWADPEYKNKILEARKNSPGWQNRDWSTANKKAAATRKARGYKPSEETKKKLSETRKAKFASGELVPWNKKTKITT
jgi:hypothetical protein